jgi:hypothetical protein
MPEDILNEEEAQRLAGNKPIVSELYLRYATIAYARRIEFQPWEHYAFACLARAHYALDSIFLLNGREADSAALTRVLYEHIVAFAWLMIDPPAHYLALLSWEHGERQKMRKDIANFASTPGPTSDEITLFMIADGLDRTVPPARATPDRALAADAHWSRLVPDWSFRLRHAYASLFRAHSVNVHPTLMGLVAFSSPDPAAQATVPARMLKLRLDAEALAVFGDGLIIASVALQWPPQREVILTVFNGFEHDESPRN